MARSLQIIGLPSSAKKILETEFVNEAGEKIWVPKFKKRLRGYTVSLFYNERAPLFEYYVDEPPTVDMHGDKGDGPYLFSPLYHEELQGAPWAGGPVAHMKLIESSTGNIVVAWPVSKLGGILSDY